MNRYLVFPAGGEFVRARSAEVMWSAGHAGGHCKNKARGFVGRREGRGFRCTRYRGQSE